MRFIFSLVITCFVAFLFSLPFDKHDGQIVFAILWAIFFCTLYLAFMIQDGVHALANNQRIILKHIER